MAYADDIAQLQRRRALAQALMSQGMQPQGQMAGRFYARPTAFSTLGNLGAILGGSMLDSKLSKQEKTATDTERSRLVDALRGLTGDQTAAAPAAPPPAMPPPTPPAPDIAPNGVADSAGPPSPGRPAIASTMPAPTAPPTTPMDPKRAAALSVLQGLPVEQMQGLVGQAAVTNLFPKPKVLKEVDLGDKVGFADEAGNIVRTQPKGATPQGQTDLQRNYSAAQAQGFKGSIFDYEAGLKKAGAPATTLTVNTEKGLYGGLATERSKAINDLYGAAQAAPEMIERAGRIRKLLTTQPYTGTGAPYKLAIGKGARTLGLNYAADDAANTEALATEMARSTLDAIKSSGLAGSQGLTEGERKFLTEAVAGHISLEPETIKRLADLNERTARNTLKRWADTAGQLKKDQLDALGMAPIGQPAEPTGTGPLRGKLQQNPDGSYTYTP